MLDAPRFDGSPAQFRDDYCTESGARKLGHMIAEVWLRQCNVRLHFDVVGFNQAPDGRYAFFAPRFPHLVNGLYRP